MPSKSTQRKKQHREKKRTRKSALCKGDIVMVIAGGSKKQPLKGETGRIVRFLGEKQEWVIVDGLRMVTKHQKQTAPGESSGKVPKEAGIHISNLMYYVEKLKKPVRLKHMFLEDGKKVRGYLDPETKEFAQV